MNSRFTTDVRGLRFTVFGLARSGTALCRLLVEHGATVRASDARPLSELPGAAAELESLQVPFVPQSEAALLSTDVAVLSPGVPPDLPLFLDARAHGVHVTGDVEIAARFLRGPIAGVTGSNGKTTVTALLGHLLQQSGIPCQIGGNIGTPVAALVDSSRDGQWNVLELSSFQLEHADQLHLRIAVALNVTPDHLDRHHTFENYAAAKAGIFRNQTPADFAVLNFENEPARAYAARTAAQVFWFHAGGQAAPGFFQQDGMLYCGPDPFMPAAEIPLRGRHNIENVLAGACAAHLAGAPLPALRQAVRSFPGVEHRIEFVRHLNGIDYYNDSKATNVDATIKALESFDSGLWVILGGKDKNSDYRPLIPLLQARARQVLLIGAATEIIAGHLGDSVPLVRCGDLPAAIAHAFTHARPGDTVLLAPACASFDQFTGYEQRGRAFKEIVHHLEERN
jgi:UDP-N-acetylmuramoylalanine--D-glutamate ligase